jgi:chromosome partitioning protein
MMHIIGNTQYRKMENYKYHECTKNIEEKNMITIAVANLKGGVGKTTISFNLSSELAKKRGIKVLAVDNDSQSHLTGAILKNSSDLSANIIHAYQGKKITPQVVNKSLHIIGSDGRLAQITDGDIDTLFRLKESLETKNSIYDYAIIDCLPSSSFVQMAGLAATDYVLIPVKPSSFDLKGLVDFMKNVEKIRNRLNPALKILGIVINQFDGRKTCYERDLEKALRETYNKLVFKVRINKRVDIATSPAFNKSITEYAPKSLSAIEFRSFTREVLKRVKEGYNG